MTAPGGPETWRPCDVDPSGHARRVLEFDKVLESVAAHARTAGGRALVLDLVPSSDPEGVRAEQSLVGEACRALEERLGPWTLVAAEEARDLLREASRPGTRLEPPELLRVADTLEAAGRLRRALDAAADRLPLLCERAAGLGRHEDLVAAVHAVVDPRGELREDASPALRAIRRDLQRQRETLLSRLEALQRAAGASPDMYVTLRAERYVIPVRADHASAVRGIVHDRSASGATLFVEPLEVLDANNELQRLRDAEQREAWRILQELTARVGAEAGPAAASIEAVERVDAVQARALWAGEWQAAAPRIGDRLRLLAARHPLLEMQLRAQGRVPVPLELDPGDARALVVTGPNAGGKTVALKTVGLAVLLHQAGVPVPARPESELPVFARLHADIGDEQSIEAAESTFSSHLKHVVAAVGDAGPRTLALLDELMAGTDPEEGAALARVVLRRLVVAGGMALVTTHLAALKLFAHTEPGLENAGMAFDPQSRTPLFRLQPGVPGSSNALAIAERMGLDPALLEAAKEERGELAGRLELALEALQAEGARLASSAARAEAAEAEAKRIREEHAAALAKHLSLRRTALAAARREAADLVSDAKARLERAVREVREAQASAESIRAAHAEIEEIDSALAPVTESAPVPEVPEAEGEPEPGDRVWVQPLGREGILESTDAGGRARVRCGNVAVSVAARELQRLGRARADRTDDAAPRGGYASPETEVVPTRLDLRGLESAPALEAVATFLDRLLLQGCHEATIVHGKGTGALRRAVQGYLAQHPDVAAYRLGEHGEGGSGVTIVQLR